MDVSKIKRFRNPERSDIYEVLLKEDRSYNVQVSGTRLVITFVLPKF
jgi:hypothetical protein